MAFSSNLASRLFLVVAATIALYALLVVFTGWEEFRARLGSFPLSYLPALLALSGLNYGLRYVRWEIYLRTLGIRLRRVESLGLFFATFVMVVTPGKLGEAFKAGILRERNQVPLATGLPIVLAERLFDFFAVLLLAAVGLLAWTGPVSEVTLGLFGIALIPVFFFVLRSRRVRQVLLRRASRAPFLRRHQLGLEEAMHSMGQLLGGKVSTWSLLLSTLAWGAECLSLWLVCVASGLTVPWLAAVFIYAAATLIGSLTFLPGGLGGTEFTLIGLLKTQGVANGSAVSVALIVRALTLWLAVLVGLVALGLGRKMFFGLRPESTESIPNSESGPPQ